MARKPHRLRCRLAAVLSTTWCAATLSAFGAKPVEPPAPEKAAGSAADAATPSGKGTRTHNVTINLINRLVEKKILTAEEAAELVRMAEEDAAAAATQVAPAAVTPVPSEPPLVPAPGVLPDGGALPPGAAAQEMVVPSLEPTFAASDESVRVPYIPEIVKAQMREEIKSEVLEQARREGWGSVAKIPDWVPRFRVNADIRVRYENFLYPAGNDNTGAFPNFNAINTGAPFDVAGNIFSPQFNVDQNRTRTRLRMRVGAEADMGEGFTGGIRLATGNNNSPVSVNQTFGQTDGTQGGNFSKYGVWVDRAFVKYELNPAPEQRFAATIGRFDNLFFHTDLTWDPDIALDGLAFEGKYPISSHATPFVLAGVFPIFNSALNFPNNQPSKFESQDKWLYAVQLGTDLKLAEKVTAKLAATYYYYDNVEGRLSSPFTPLTALDAGDTDETRPFFAQRGNTYMALRDIVANANNNFGTINQFQYFGLATGFRPIVATGRVNFNHFEPFQISVGGEYVKNLAFDRAGMNVRAVNNRGAVPAGGGAGAFVGSDTGWMVDLKLGKPALEKRWDWNAAVGYRYLGSDAIIDAFSDTAFGDGGTNRKGYTVGVNVALSQRTFFTVRWASTDSIDGPPLRSDNVQIDFNGKF
jgi:hypothetical protein